MSIWSTLINKILRYPDVNKELHEPLILQLHLQMLFNFIVQLAAAIFPSPTRTPKGFCYAHPLRGNQSRAKHSLQLVSEAWKQSQLFLCLGFSGFVPGKADGRHNEKEELFLISWPLEMLLDQHNLLLWHKNKVGYHESGVKADVFNKLHFKSAQIKNFASLLQFLNYAWVNIFTRIKSWISPQMSTRM